MAEKNHRYSQKSSQKAVVANQFHFKSGLTGVVYFNLQTEDDK